MRQVANENIEDALSLWERKSEFSGVNRCSARVRVLWATHRYSGWAGQRECRFLMDALP